MSAKGHNTVPIRHAAIRTYLERAHALLARAAFDLSPGNGDRSVRVAAAEAVLDAIDELRAVGRVAAADEGDEAGESAVMEIFNVLVPLLRLGSDVADAVRLNADAQLQDFARGSVPENAARVRALIERIEHLGLDTSDLGVEIGLAALAAVGRRRIRPSTEPAEPDDQAVRERARDEPPRPAFPFTEELRQVILDLARQPDIHSVSCPFSDFELWKGLLQEQVRRAKEKGLPPQEAFYLCGPDSGVPGLTGMPLLGDDDMAPACPDSRTGGYRPDMWDGEIHVPYEGTTGADLFVLPSWRVALNLARQGARLPRMMNYECNYLLTNRDLGEPVHATRSKVAGCWLYKSTEPYRDCSSLALSREARERVGARHE